MADVPKLVKNPTLLGPKGSARAGTIAKALLLGSSILTMWGAVPAMGMPVMSEPQTIAAPESMTEQVAAPKPLILSAASPTTLFAGHKSHSSHSSHKSHSSHHSSSR